MKVVTGNVLDSNADVIIHQVNCQGVMGSGVAKQVKDRYPVVYEMYKAKCNEYKTSIHYWVSLKSVTRKIIR